MIFPVRRLLGNVLTTCALGALAAVALPVSSAGASLINLNTCNNSTLSQPFARWLDFSSYELAPGGDFEGSGWSLNAGAQVVPGSESYAATGTLGSYSLSLPEGSSATSPATCVDAAYPTLRFFVAGSGTVAVSIVYNGASIPAGVATAGGGWEPTPVMLTSSAITGLLSGGTANVSVQVTALTGNPQVDDVFVDPWGRG